MSQEDRPQLINTQLGIFKCKWLLYSQSIHTHIIKFSSNAYTSIVTLHCSRCFKMQLLKTRNTIFKEQYLPPLPIVADVAKGS